MYKDAPHEDLRWAEEIAWQLERAGLRPQRGDYITIDGQTYQVYRRDIHPASAEGEQINVCFLCCPYDANPERFL